MWSTTPDAPCPSHCSISGRYVATTTGLSRGASAARMRRRSRRPPPGGGSTQPSARTRLARGSEPPCCPMSFEPVISRSGSRLGACTSGLGGTRTSRCSCRPAKTSIRREVAPHTDPALTPRCRSVTSAAYHSRSPSSLAACPICFRAVRKATGWSFVTASAAASMLLYRS